MLYFGPPKLLIFYQHSSGTGKIKPMNRIYDLVCRSWPENASPSPPFMSLKKIRSSLLLFERARKCCQILKSYFKKYKLFYLCHNIIWRKTVSLKKHYYHPLYWWCYVNWIWWIGSKKTKLFSKIYLCQRLWDKCCKIVWKLSHQSNFQESMGLVQVRFFPLMWENHELPWKMTL